MAKKTREPDDGRVAGSVHQLKPQFFSPEDRQRRREVALKHRPWQYATGPRTPEGKAKSPRMAGMRRRVQYREGRGKRR